MFTTVICDDIARVHGVKLTDHYRLARIRYNGRSWVRVWATLLPATERAPDRLYVCPCPLFPCGGSWSLGESYLI